MDELLKRNLAAPARDCWNSIGVQGDRSCPELSRHVHCRNCPAFQASAEQLLEREAAPEQIAIWTRHFAQASATEQTDLLSIFIFRLHAEWLALPTRVLEGVVDTRTVHSLPHRRGGALLGVASVRGELVVCVSLAKVLGCERSAASAPASSARPRLLVLRRDGRRFVARVDEVHGTHRCAREELVCPPDTIGRAAHAHTQMMLSWSGRAVACVDDERLFAALERSMI